MEYVADDARQQGLIRYAVLPKDSQFVNYHLDADEREGSCNPSGVDLTNVAERELNHEAEAAMRDH